MMRCRGAGMEGKGIEEATLTFFAQWAFTGSPAEPLFERLFDGVEDLLVHLQVSCPVSTCPPA